MKYFFPLIISLVVLSSCANSPHKIYAERFQMNTLVQVILYAENQKEAKKWAETALDIMADLENRYSIHRTNSLLFTLNEKGYGEIDEELLGVWQETEKLFELSGGLFDPTVEPLMRLWGFYNEKEKYLPSEKTIQQTLSSVGFDAIQKKDRHILLRGRRVDFGGILKGYALDKAASYLKTKPVRGFLVNAGGNIIVWGEKPDKTPWNIAIRHPRNPAEVIALFCLSEGSVATSGDYEQFFLTNGKRYHHILDPTTGYPSTTGVASVTVVAPTGIQSDGLSTVMFLLGREKGISLANKLHLGVCYIMDDLSVWTNQFFPGLSLKP
ncbi:FAD:protein FMN transferase [Thermospira aquatica]|uniref:FAD:protein FMN transferase n=1 Tax=Thermospira aquatica TaxID=2828656 RepID=A0AAX3BG38_9SPIR|nr:FAD:protein FMN transferase [Thermospira aquatica]URA11093.1 FAD:protein FMN transferase [Thermospira aquatica]